MKEKYIAVIDSGIGGTSILNSLSKSLSDYNIIYYGDNFNAPYGNKRPEKLLSLTALNIASVVNVQLSAVILACNTLSVTVRGELENALNVPVFGVYPPAVSLKDDKTLLIATPVTAKQYNSDKNITVVPLPNLAAEIERNAFSLGMVNLKNHLPNDKGFFKRFDNVILGCTHYELIKNEFIDHFCPANIICPTRFTVNSVAEKLKSGKSSVNTCKNQIFFVGKNSEINKNFYKTVVANSEKVPKNF